MSTIKKPKNEFLYFVLRNNKFLIGAAVFAFFLIFAIVGPFLTSFNPLDFVEGSCLPPDAKHWFGTTKLGQDVFAQLVQGTRLAFYVGFVGGGIATIIGLLVGFIAGYKGGMFDELLMMLTNIVLVIPTLALLIILAAYLPERGIGVESLIIGFTSWPWVARAVRSQTFALRTREFVDLSRISGVRSMGIIAGEIAPNMFSYVFLVFILQFGGSILIAAGLDFIGLGPTDSISLGLMMQYSFRELALPLGYWWWFLPPGIIITVIVSALYFMNTGLDEIFNPKLRAL